MNSTVLVPQMARSEPSTKKQFTHHGCEWKPLVQPDTPARKAARLNAKLLLQRAAQEEQNTVQEPMEVPETPVKTGAYRTVVADPPWPMPETGKTTRGETDSKGNYTSKSGRVVSGAWWGRHRGRSVKLPYPIMTVEEIANLRPPCANAAHLYLWTVNRHIEDAYRVARAWGFRPAQLLTWCKTPMGIGFGGAYCNTTEFVLFCRRGSLAHQKRVDSTWWKWPRPYEGGHIAHSAKPDAFLDMVMEVSPPPYLELFARTQRLGWHSWGNESLCHIATPISA